MGSLKVVLVFAFLYNLGAGKEQTGRYEPTWDSIDKRPLPQWYDDAKFGIFIHWGVYSVPSFGSEWFWFYWKTGSKDHEKFMKDNYRPGFTYQEFAKDFKAEFYNPDEWADLFQKSGAKYIVLTSKHHEGYTLWPSTYSFSWNAMDVGSHRDLVGDLANSIRQRTDLRFGLYHSFFEWFNPRYVADKESNFVDNTFLSNKVMPELLELVNKYQPDIVWSDGEGEAPDTYWKSTEFLAWLFNDSPVKDHVVVNDRWGSGLLCKHGDFYTCADRYNPGVLQPHKWENAMTIDKYSWGFRRNARFEDFYSTHELLVILAQTVSCGGNLLMNIGPTSDGRIIPIFQERLLDVGNWLSINGEAIYGTRPWTYQNETDINVWYTAKDPAVYVVVLDWPEDNLVALERVKPLFENKNPTVTLLGNSDAIQWKNGDKSVQFRFPDRAVVNSQWAWVLKIEPKIVNFL